MYPFTFHRPTTVRQAVNLLTKNEDAKLLAGGHSLIPVMKFRLASPPIVIDLSQVDSAVGELNRRPPTSDKSTSLVGTQLGRAELHDRTRKLSERRRNSSRRGLKASRPAHPYA